MGHQLFPDIAADDGTVAETVEGMGDTHQSPLGFNSGYSLLSREVLGDLLGEEKADDLSFAGQDLLAHDHGKLGYPFHLQGAGDGIVVGDGNAANPDLLAAADDALQRRVAIT